MKNQWFGDINDYYKYGLLRLITTHTRLKVGVCWMLTRAGYLYSPKKWRDYDPDLYDFLGDCVKHCEPCNISKVKEKGILPNCQFYSEILEDNEEARQQYFDDVKRRMPTRACDLLFLDADNGMKVKSTPKGRRVSSKYLYWDEAETLYKSGYSLLIFQYHPRKNRQTLRDDLKEKVRIHIDKDMSPSFYETQNVTFLLIAQSGHKPMFRELDKSIRDCWPGKIKPV